ncbi:MAG: Asp-tRNA(Asn)/Glu-tRNA(Gln) amidotransferase subunit GatC [Actinomycetota bacterium]|nr:Asp-tRNA(Asn)/Glu-tRNA(Gln) amidotransferase subunit GatC [Actinomycetota bacterium]
MSIDKREVEHVALLARLALSEAEKESFTKQLSQILDHAGKIAELKTDDVEPTSHPLPLKNVLRADEIKPSFTVEEALSSAPSKENNMIKVPNII